MLWIILLAVLFALLIYKFCKTHSYWRKRNVKQPGILNIVSEIVKYGILQRKHLIEIIKMGYNKYPGTRLYGTYSFGTPSLIITDPDLIKVITVKDFDYFVDHNSNLDPDLEPLLTRNLIALNGDKWRNMRATLSPAFTSSKMKMMFTLICDVSEQYTNYFLEKNESLQTIELRDVITRCTNDVIATCAFGVKCDSMREPDNEFYRMGKEATKFASFKTILKALVILLMPKIAKFLKISIFDKNISNFFTKVIGDSVKLREEKGITRPDMIQLLMDARKDESEQEVIEPSNDTGFATVKDFHVGKAKKTETDITLVDMTAQALIFFLAGFETVSTLMCFLGHELACNPDVQEKLRKEIEETLKKCNGSITYEALNKMKYLDMVVSEALRKWPIGVMLDRKCVAAYTIQPQNSGEVPIDVDIGNLVFIPVLGIHHDPQYYPNPDKFDPERFNDENKDNIKPYTYFPFGSGPRNCIASRFALMEIKTIYFHLLSKFEFVVIEKTDVPIKFGRGFDLRPKNGFWLGLQKRL